MGKSYACEKNIDHVHLVTNIAKKYGHSLFELENTD